MTVSLGNQLVHATARVALPLNVIFERANVRTKTLDSVIINPANACAEFDHLHHLQRGKVFTEQEDIFIAFEPVVTRKSVFMISSSRDDVGEKWPAFQCMYAEILLGDGLYVLNSGKWYAIARDFADQVAADYAGIPSSQLALPECTVNDEGNYNRLAVQSLPTACCMDQQFVMHGGGQNKIEFCDIYTTDGKIVHVKRYSASSVLSHLFSQGLVAGELFVADREFRQKLNEKLPVGHKLPNPADRPKPLSKTCFQDGSFRGFWIQARPGDSCADLIPPRFPIRHNFCRGLFKKCLPACQMPAFWSPTLEKAAEWIMPDGAGNIRLSGIIFCGPSDFFLYGESVRDKVRHNFNLRRLEKVCGFEVAQKKARRG